MSGLSAKECVPCRGGVPPLGREEIAKLLPELDGWEVINDHHLKKSYKFKDFREALTFVNRIGELAEEQGHLEAVACTRLPTRRCATLTPKSSARRESGVRQLVAQ